MEAEELVPMKGITGVSCFPLFFPLSFLCYFFGARFISSWDRPGWSAKGSLQCAAPAGTAEENRLCIPRHVLSRSHASNEEKKNLSSWLVIQFGAAECQTLDEGGCHGGNVWELFETSLKLM